MLQFCKTLKLYKNVWDCSYQLLSKLLYSLQSTLFTFVLLSFERCRDFVCRFLPDREISFQDAATDKLVIIIHFPI